MNDISNAWFTNAAHGIVRVQEIFSAGQIYYTVMVNDIPRTEMLHWDDPVIQLADPIANGLPQRLATITRAAERLKQLPLDQGCSTPDEITT